MMILIHYANAPCFNKQCVLSGNISKYLILNIDFILSQTNITHKRIRLKKQEMKQN